jgi:hypothetical protein
MRKMRIRGSPEPSLESYDPDARAALDLHRLHASVSTYRGHRRDGHGDGGDHGNGKRNGKGKDR